MRLNFEINEEQDKAIKRLLQRTGARDMKDLLNNSVSLLEWAANETAKGNEIAAVNEDDDTYRVLVMPLLQYVAQHERHVAQHERPAPAVA